MSALELARPAAAHLPSYTAALERGWSPDNIRGAAAALEELERIRTDAAAFLAGMDDRQAKGPPLMLSDGSKVARTPGLRRWRWDGEFVGSIGFRWQPGTSELPPHGLGHIGFAVVPWKPPGARHSGLGAVAAAGKGRRACVRRHHHRSR